MVSLPWQIVSWNILRRLRLLVGRCSMIWIWSVNVVLRLRAMLSKWSIHWIRKNMSLILLILRDTLTSRMRSHEALLLVKEHCLSLMQHREYRLRRFQTSIWLLIITWRLSLLSIRLICQMLCLRR